MQSQNNDPSEGINSLSDDAVIDITFELGQLREEVRHGWQRLHENPESVAEHTFRASMLGYLLAHMEGFDDPNYVATMIVFHDMHEVRVGDRDLVELKYNTIDEVRALYDQTSALGVAGESIRIMWEEVETGSTEAGVIAKDAEILEMCFTARELQVKGVEDAACWIDNTEKRLKTDSAKRLLTGLREADPNRWWKELTRK